MDEFYRDVIGLNTETKGLPVLEKKKGWWPVLVVACSSYSLLFPFAQNMLYANGPVAQHNYTLMLEAAVCPKRESRQNNPELPRTAHNKGIPKKS